jgi:uncharacterized protein (DUF2235 family)
MKNIVICADGTWNRPEKNLKKDFPTNVLKLARAIKPTGKNGIPQQVFYDWGVGSYYDPVIGGATGKGIDKNIMDNYRYIIQNYTPGDAIYLFGFSRGAYTVRCLSGLINNCGILKRPDARLIQTAFDLYKKSGKDNKPDGINSINFRDTHSHQSRTIKFIGVWDTVGALGIPFSFMGLLDKKDEFYDAEIGSNVRIARHAMAIDELRSDFEPTIWSPKQRLDLKQAWFLGVHSDVGGSYAPNDNGILLSDIPLSWMMNESKAAGLAIEPHLDDILKPDHRADLHQSRRHIYRSKRKFYRPIDHGKGELLIHESVKKRWDSRTLKYRPKNLKEYLEKNNNTWPTLIT